MGCSFSDQNSSLESLTVVVHGSSHDSRDVLGQQSESTRHLMGTGAALLVLDALGSKTALEGERFEVRLAEQPG